MMVAQFFGDSTVRILISEYLDTDSTHSLATAITEECSEWDNLAATMREFNMTPPDDCPTAWIRDASWLAGFKLALANFDFVMAAICIVRNRSLRRAKMEKGVIVGVFSAFSPKQLHRWKIWDDGCSVTYRLLDPNLLGALYEHAVRNHGLAVVEAWHTYFPTITVGSRHAIRSMLVQTQRRTDYLTYIEADLDRDYLAIIDDYLNFGDEEDEAYLANLLGQRVQLKDLIGKRDDDFTLWCLKAGLVKLSGKIVNDIWRWKYGHNPRLTYEQTIKHLMRAGYLSYSILNFCEKKGHTGWLVACANHPSINKNALCLYLMQCKAYRSFFHSDRLQAALAAKELRLEGHTTDDFIRLYQTHALLSTIDVPSFCESLRSGDIVSAAGMFNKAGCVRLRLSDIYTEEFWEGGA